jgi:hypothetical protein
VFDSELDYVLKLVSNDRDCREFQAPVTNPFSNIFIDLDFLKKVWGFIYAPIHTSYPPFPFSNIFIDLDFFFSMGLPPRTNPHLLSPFSFSILH